MEQPNQTEETTNNSPKDELTAREDLRQQIAAYYKVFSEWLAFDKDESLGLNILRLLYKIPVAIFTVFISPILLLFVIIAFFAAF